MGQTQLCMFMPYIYVHSFCQRSPGAAKLLSQMLSSVLLLDGVQLQLVLQWHTLVADQPPVGQGGASFWCALQSLQLCTLPPPCWLGNVSSARTKLRRNARKCSTDPDRLTTHTKMALSISMVCFPKRVLQNRKSAVELKKMITRVHRKNIGKTSSPSFQVFCHSPWGYCFCVTPTVTRIILHCD